MKDTVRARLARLTPNYVERTSDVVGERPGGMRENSPAIHCWEGQSALLRVPEGRLKMNQISHVPFFSRPSGTLGGGHHPCYAPINRWAIIDTPSGRKIAEENV